MAKLASYEKNEGKPDIDLGKYYKSDYVRLQLLKTMVSVTVGYLLILVMIILYYSEKIIEQAVNLDYRTIGMRALGIYIVLLTIYLVGALIGYSMKYAASRKKLARYFRMLKKLERIYSEEENMSDTGNIDTQSEQLEETL